MIRRLAVRCAPSHVCSNCDRISGAETASNELAMEAVHPLSEFSLHVCHGHHTELSLKALDNVFKQLYYTMFAFQAMKMSKSAKAKVDQLLAQKSHQVQEQNIHKISAAMDVQVYGAEMVYTTKQRQWQVILG